MDVVRKFQKDKTFFLLIFLNMCYNDNQKTMEWEDDIIAIFKNYFMLFQRKLSYYLLDTHQIANLVKSLCLHSTIAASHVYWTF